MTDRLIVAYTLLALLVLSLAALVAWLRYNSRERVLARNRRRADERRRAARKE